MLQISSFRRLVGVSATALLLGAVPAWAQTPAAAPPAPDDTPSIKVGATIFADYTLQTNPKITDAAGNPVDANQFTVGRSYINITGNISHLIAFRITPDIARETGAGSSLNGSYTFRLKYAFAQFNLDDWMTKGSFIRLGLQTTPWIDYAEGIYRYRFQGPTFVDREGFLSSSDQGVSFHYNFAQNYGDIHTGIYNGEGYGKTADPNNEKSFQIRGTIRPLAKGATAARGLRISAFYDADNYLKSAEKRRAIVNLTYEHPYLNAGFDYVHAQDQTTPTANRITANGYSIWFTPRSTIGWEGLFRFDHLEPNTAISSQTHSREIAGVAYWFPHKGGVSTAVMLDFDNTTFKGYTPNPPTQRKIGVHALVNF